MSLQCEIFSRARSRVGGPMNHFQIVRVTGSRSSRAEIAPADTERDSVDTCAPFLMRSILSLRYRLPVQAGVASPLSGSHFCESGHRGSLFRHIVQIALDGFADALNDYLFRKTGYGWYAPYVAAHRQTKNLSGDKRRRATGGRADCRKQSCKLPRELRDNTPAGSFIAGGGAHHCGQSRAILRIVPSIKNVPNQSLAHCAPSGQCSRGAALKSRVATAANNSSFEP